jgi:tRNA (cytidine56-2'-O)-methyltransferase
MIKILRLGHRIERDYRVSTHLCLVARAFGADEVIFTTKDEKVKESIEKVVSQWGGDFKISYTNNWKKFLKEFKGDKIHLTMYGLPFWEYNPKNKDILIIVGAEKVPKEVYELSDYNLSIGNQPHSEIAALAVFLYYLNGKEVLYRDFPNAKIKVIPSERGKLVKKL